MMETISMTGSCLVAAKVDWCHAEGQWGTEGHNEQENLTGNLQKGPYLLQRKSHIDEQQAEDQVVRDAELQKCFNIWPRQVCYVRSRPWVGKSRMKHKMKISEWMPSRMLALQNPWTLKACRDSPLFQRKKLALLSCLQKLQKCLPHKALVTPSGAALPPLLAVRQATEVKSQHNYARDMLDLIGKERDDTLELLQELASMYYKEPGNYP